MRTIQNDRDFKGIWIPAEIWLSTELTKIELLVLVEIDSLDRNGQGCFATNGYFAEFFGLSKGRISKIISSLSEKGFVKVVLVRNEGSKEIKERRIYSLKPYNNKVDPIVENSHTPIVENSQENNTVTNNTKPKRLTASDETVSLPLNIYSLLEKTNLSDNTYTAIARFIDMYYRYYGKQHPKIKQDNWDLVVERFDDLVEDKNLDPYCEYAELDLFDEKYLAYFEKYQQSKANIYHFTRALTSIDGDLKYTYQHVKEMGMR